MDPQTRRPSRAAAARAEHAGAPLDGPQAVTAASRPEPGIPEVTEIEQLDWAAGLQDRQVRLILEETSDLISAHNGRTEFLYASNASRLLGYEPEELLGRPIFELIYPADIPVAQSVRARLASHEHDRLEIRFRRKDGSPLWVETVVHVLHRDEQGEMDYAVGVTRDISARKEIESRKEEMRLGLAAAAAEWRATFDMVHSAILLLDGHGVVRRINSVARNLLGRDEAEILQARIADLVRGQGEPWEAAAELVKNVASAGGRSDVQIRDPASGAVWQVQVQGLQADLPSPQVVLKINDITRTVRLEESLQRSRAMASLGNIIAGVVHEIRNPLFAMSALLDALECRFLSSGADEHVDLMRKEFDRIRSLVETLVDCGQAARVELRPGTLEGVLSRAVSPCRTHAETAGVELMIAVLETTGTVLFDEQKLVQAVKNVVDNAIQHSPPGARVEVREIEVQQSGLAWRGIAVSDEGPGFPPEELARLFQPFYSRRAGGMGLGLATTAFVVEAHGGRILAHNRHSRSGATVQILLPKQT
jgi:PAS domain S-box-containing protein